MVNSARRHFDTTRLGSVARPCDRVAFGASTSRGAATDRLGWKISGGLRIELDGLAEGGDVAREEKLAQRRAIELLALDPIETRRLDHAEPGSEGAAQDGPRLRNAVALQDPAHDDVAVLLEDRAHLGVDGDAAAVDGGVDRAMLLDVVEV